MPSAKPNETPETARVNEFMFSTDKNCTNCAKWGTPHCSIASRFLCSYHTEKSLPPIGSEDWQWEEGRTHLSSLEVRGASRISPAEVYDNGYPVSLSDEEAARVVELLTILRAK